jgi:hypothetical protein
MENLVPSLKLLIYLNDENKRRITCFNGVLVENHWLHSSRRLSVTKHTNHMRHKSKLRDATNDAVVSNLIQHTAKLLLENDGEMKDY